jgi:hypothetical protein
MVASFLSLSSCFLRMIRQQQQQQQQGEESVQG